MIQDFFLSLLEISFAVGIMIIVISLLSPIMNKRYSLRWKYWIWLGLAVRLLLPLNFESAARQLTFTLPDVPLQAPAVSQPVEDVGIPFLLTTQDRTVLSSTDILAALWLLGAFVFLFAHLAVYLHYKKRITGTGRPVEDAALSVLIGAITAELKLRAKFRTLISPLVSSPMIIGFFRPVLVLPQRRYTEEELYFILKHELIHLKRRDVVYKFLLVAANSVHWFNPAVYLMRKEAALDLELFCDEEVVRGTDRKIRKAYTETLLATLPGQTKKTVNLTTQFYGGTAIMKKRFQTILTHRKKRNGLAICILSLLLTLSLGALIACSSDSPKSTPDSGPNASTGPASTEPSSAEPESDTEPMTEPAKQDDETQSQPNKTDSDGNDPAETLSEDAQAVQELVEKFSSAYFSADSEALKAYLSEPFEWDITVFDGKSEDVSDLAIKGLSSIQTEETGSSQTVSVEFRASARDDSLQYLTIELIKESDGWKISFYGLEM